MKKIIVAFLMCILIISGCTPKDDTSDIENNNEVNKLKEKVKALESELEKKEAYIESIKEQEDLFPVLSNKALTFVRGQTEGNIHKLKEVISDNISIVEEKGKIYGVYEAYGQKIKYLLYDENSKRKYKDMVIQGYGYLEGEDSYIIHIREFYVDENDKPVSPPTFLNLYFVQVDGNWKIEEFGFDV
ncbi:hypothetical protein [Dethiothermospora halolimnae]|uniref:hypothetical protein n=1 Tax=Dethiothermospora halolimnae TaxID=3114390 RepID=UPI003CCC01AD